MLKTRRYCLAPDFLHATRTKDVNGGFQKESGALLLSLLVSLTLVGHVAVIIFTVIMFLWRKFMFSFLSLSRFSLRASVIIGIRVCYVYTVIHAHAYRNTHIHTHKIRTNKPANKQTNNEKEEQHQVYALRWMGKSNNETVDVRKLLSDPNFWPHCPARGETQYSRSPRWLTEAPQKVITEVP